MYCHYGRHSFIAHHRPSRRRVPTPVRPTAAAAAAIDEKSCWRSSTEYNSIRSRSSSPPRPDRKCCYYRNGSIRVATLAERSRICSSATSKFCNSLNLSTLTISQSQAVDNGYAQYACRNQAYVRTLRICEVHFQSIIVRK